MKNLTKIFCSVLIALAVISTADIITSYAADDVCYTTGGKSKVTCEKCSGTGKVTTTTKITCDQCNGSGTEDCEHYQYRVHNEAFGEHWGLEICHKCSGTREVNGECCPRCGGSSYETFMCPKCGRTGRDSYSINHVGVSCDKCGHTGKVTQKTSTTCTTCNGKKKVTVDTTVNHPHDWQTVYGKCSGSAQVCRNDASHVKNDNRKDHSMTTDYGECGGSYTYCKNCSYGDSDGRYGHSWITVNGECGGSYTYCRNNINHTQGSDSRYGHDWVQDYSTTTAYGECSGSAGYWHYKCKNNPNHTTTGGNWDDRTTHNYSTTYSSDGKTRWQQCSRCSNKISYKHRLDVGSTNCSANTSNGTWFSQGTTRTVTWTAYTGYHFESTSATTTSQTVTMNAPQSVSATANANQYTITFNKGLTNGTQALPGNIAVYYDQNVAIPGIGSLLGRSYTVTLLQLLLASSLRLFLYPHRHLSVQQLHIPLTNRKTGPNIFSS